MCLRKQRQYAVARGEKVEGESGGWLAKAKQAKLASDRAAKEARLAQHRALLAATGAGQERRTPRKSGDQGSDDDSLLDEDEDRARRLGGPAVDLFARRKAEMGDSDSYASSGSSIGSPREGEGGAERQRKRSKRMKQPKKKAGKKKAPSKLDRKLKKQLSSMELSVASHRSEGDSDSTVLTDDDDSALQAPSTSAAAEPQAVPPRPCDDLLTILHLLFAVAVCGCAQSPF